MLKKVKQEKVGVRSISIPSLQAVYDGKDPLSIVFVMSYDRVWNEIGKESNYLDKS